MKRKRQFWTKERCQEEALKYDVKKDFQNFSGSAYNKAFKMKWLDEICVHMIQNKLWTFSSCQQEALKYTSKVEFKKKSGSAYNKSCVNKWIDEICQHMIIIGTLKKRCVYVATFSDNHVYIGLTYSFNRRMKTHLIDENSSVYKHIKESNIVPEFKQITDYIEINDAIIKEGYYVNQYRTNGWEILNQTKTGTVGGNVLIWTKEKCMEDGLKYNTRYEYFKKSTSSYQAAKRYGWFNEVCKHMLLKKRRNFWNHETCKIDALKYKTRNNYQRKSSRSYLIAKKLGILDEICAHMSKNNSSNHLKQ